jgi:hypothetical protein
MTFWYGFGLAIMVAGFAILAVAFIDCLLGCSQGFTRGKK